MAAEKRYDKCLACELLLLTLLNDADGRKIDNTCCLPANAPLPNLCTVSLPAKSLFRFIMFWVTYSFATFCFFDNIVLNFLFDKKTGIAVTRGPILRFNLCRTWMTWHGRTPPRNLAGGELDKDPLIVLKTLHNSAEMWRIATVFGVLCRWWCVDVLRVRITFFTAPHGGGKRN